MIKKDQWSEYQKQIFLNIARGEGHSIVEALAGSGKSTTAIESFKYIPRGKKAVALAFNKIIAQNLREKSPMWVETATFHSFGLKAIKQRFGNVVLDDYKTTNIIRDLLDKDADYELIVNLAEATAFCKYGLIDTPTKIEEVILRYGIDTCDMERDPFISLVVKTLSECKKKTNIIDFNDMCWFPYIYNLGLGQYDYVFIDERQDLNKSQLVMAKMACKRDGGRIIAIGDENQALYSWRAADTSIIQDIRKDPNTKTLPLPISYRCPKKIIELVKPWVPMITCPNTAVEGHIENITLNQLYNKAKPGCFRTQSY